MNKINDFLDKYILPLPVAFLTHRFVILGTILLLVPLIYFAHQAVFVLAVNSYLNTMSVAVSSIVLLFTTINEAKSKARVEAQERRAQEDHAHMVAIHKLIVQHLAEQDEEMDAIRQAIAKLSGQEYQPKPLQHKPLKDIDLEAMHKRGSKRFKEGGHMLTMDNRS